ncbi:hypothetical protein CORC01_13306 [Colletotrichum orchidophilum]|uniref:RING finger domain-containing protein n=1 Tax=Colletotrichum orchidophilum TaxID=1209926 RepID=A0A1G4AQD7_9PEZI|nr:uncharacterized protein CORC01_13306 [Colletotrichum orchidophilum]OHE91388.1 hypothetical protein CORC01_13306 [Colletotrichum orchidophilum]
MAAMRDAELEDVPPPPYSETDIYSTSGRPSNAPSNSPHVPSHHGENDAASRVSSHASSHSEVIFTPPLTPRTSGPGSNGGGGGGGIHHHGSNASLDLSSRSLATGGFHQPQSASASASAYSEFTASYFESRPAPAALAPSPRDHLLVHALTVTPTSTPDDVPYSPAWAALDVTQQDWATFTNCLIPHHAAARNEAVINRKLQAEEEALAAAAAASNGSGAGGQSTHATAQLDQIRADPDTDPGAAAAASGLRREDAEGVVAQWNEGFFRPRGMLITLIPEVVEEDLHMPGAWDRSFDRTVENPAAGGGGDRSVGSGPTLVPFPAHPGQLPAMQPQQPQSGSTDSRNSWTFGGITVSTDGISIGDRIIAGSNGIRVGNLIADENGIRFGSTATPRAQAHYVGPGWAPPPPPAPPGPAPVPMFGSGSGPFPPAGPHLQPIISYPGPNEQHPFLQGGGGPGQHAPHEGGGGGGAARGRPPGRYPSDQRSISSSSSASSTSSTSSASSIGSLPDYEDLYPSQLPIYKQRLTSWLAHPEQPVTKDDIAQLREEIRSASATAAAEDQKDQRDNQVDPAATNTSKKVEEKALKAEIRSITQDWRKLKRQQRAARKEKRRERRTRRKEEKRERREERRENREARREQREAQREARRGDGGRGGSVEGPNHHHHQQHQHHHHQHQHQQQHQQYQQHHQGQHQQHHGPGPTAWGAPGAFVPPPRVHVPPRPVVHGTPPMPNFPHNVSPVPNAWGFPWGPPGPGRGPVPGGFPGGGGGPGPWGGWGRGHGGAEERGSESTLPPSINGGVPPGAWPTAPGDRSPSYGGGGSSTPPIPAPAPSSQALFKAADEMEKEIVRRVGELDKVRTEMRDSNPGRGRCGGGRGRGRGGWGWGRVWGERGSDQMTHRLEEEIDELSRNVEKLRVEADAEFARELAAEDQKSGGW